MLSGWAVAIVALVGLLMYVLSANPKVARIGEILFFNGSLVTLMLVGGKVARLL